MGNRGPAPEPSIFKYLKGNPSKGALNKDEPTPDLVSEGYPPPATLDGKAVDVWHDMVARLSAMRVMTEADVPVLTRYCIETVLYLAAYEKVKSDGEQYIHWEPDPSDPSRLRIKYTQVAPWAVQMHRHHQAMLRIEQQFGLTPSSRSQVKTHGTRADSPLAQWRARNSAG
jgi:P27 family predicted phage terminase small subunit